jgi:hypothetical protein
MRPNLEVISCVSALEKKAYSENLQTIPTARRADVNAPAKQKQPKLLLLVK